MAAKHTPGPWHTFPAYEREGDWHSSIQRHGTPAYVASVTQAGVRDVEEAQANACLVAAAPELLSALTAMAERYAELAKGAVQTCGPDHPYSKARAAIAKALGE